MVNFILIDHGVEGTVSPQRIDISTAGDSIELFDFMEVLDERLGLAESSYNLVIDGEILMEYDFHDGPSATKVHLHRKPADMVEMPVVTTYRGKTVESVHAAGTTVREFQRFVARKFLVRPCRQRLYNIRISMYDDDKLADFACGGPVRVRLEVELETARHDKVFISVRRRGQPGYITLMMYGFDTFDMLAGRLEREGELKEAEEVTFACDGTIFDNWRTLGSYKLTHAKLHIIE